MDGSVRWIFFDDLKQIYNFCGVNKCNEEYYYSYICQNLNQQLNKEVFVVQLESSQNVNHAFITVTQQDRRSFKNSNLSPKEYSYDFIRMIVVKGSLNVVNRQMNIEQWVSAHTQVGRDSTIECFLNQGTYLLYVEVEKSSLHQTRICFNSYSQEKISFKFAENQDLFKKIQPNHSLQNVNGKLMQVDDIQQRFIEKFLMSKTNKGEEPGNEKFVYQEDQEVSRTKCYAAGNIYLVYENNSSHGSILKEKHWIRKKKDSTFDKEWVVELHPKQKKIVSLTVGRDEDVNDIAIQLVFSDFQLTDKKLLLNIKSIPSTSQIVKEQRLSKGVLVNAIMSTYTYSGGYAILFENFTNYSCTETLFYQLTNLKAEELDDQAKSITFNLHPGQSKLLHLFRIDHSKGIYCQLKSTYCFRG